MNAKPHIVRASADPRTERRRQHQLLSSLHRLLDAIEDMPHGELCADKPIQPMEPVSQKEPTAQPPTP